MLSQSVSRFGLATHLALAAALPAALAQFVSVGWLGVSMLWVSAAAWVWMTFEPSVLPGETVSRSRSRVFGKMIRDPFFWFLVFASAFALVRWLNSGIKLFYDAEKTIWLVKSAALTIAPASSGDEAFLPFAAVVTAATVITGVRHALGRNARIWFGVTMGAFSSVGGLAAVICTAYGVESFRESALVGFGAPWFSGSAYAMILPVSIACGIEAEERGITKARLLLAFAVAGNAVAAYVFLPVLLASGFLAVSVVTAVMSLVLCKRRAGAAPCARAASMLAFGAVAAVSSVLVPSYKEILQEKRSGFDVERAFPMDLADRNDALKRLSVAMWQDFEWGGTGVGGFALQAPFYASKDDWSILPPKPRIGPNGYLTLLVERGIVGTLFWVVGIGFLLFHWGHRLAGSVLWSREQREGRSWFFSMPAVVWTGPAVLLAALADTWFSSGIPLTAMPVCAAAAMTLASASFPKVKVRRDKETKD